MKSTRPALVGLSCAFTPSVRLLDHLGKSAMPPFNGPRAYPPSWIEQLRSAVLSPDVHWTPAEEVSTVAATHALRSWLADRRPYDGQHRQGWKSAIADFQRSVGHLGPDLRTVLGTDLAAAVSALGQLDADITSNPARTKALLQARRTSDQQLLGQLAQGGPSLKPEWVPGTTSGRRATTRR